MDSEVQEFLYSLFDRQFVDPFNYISNQLDEIDYLGALMARIPNGMFDINNVLNDDSFLITAVTASLLLHNMTSHNTCFPEILRFLENQIFISSMILML